MTRYSYIARITGLTISLLIVHLPSSVFALELKSEDLNYVFKIPGAWTVKTQDQTGFYISSQDEGKEINLSVVYVGWATLDSNYIAKIEQIVKSNNHVRLLSSKWFAIDGVPAYESIQQLGKPPHASVSVEIQVIEGAKLYDLHSMVLDGDASQDSEMQEGLSSFHFLKRHKTATAVVFVTRLIVISIVLFGVAFFVARRRRVT